MPSKKKQVRKLKREVKRRIQRNKVAQKMDEQQKMQQQEMMGKLMMLMNGGRSPGASTDPAAYLAQRESMAKAEEDRARKKRELRLEKQNLVAEGKKNKDEYDIEYMKGQIKNLEGVNERTKEKLLLQLEKAGLKGSLQQSTHDIERMKTILSAYKDAGDWRELKMDSERQKRILKELKEALNFAVLPEDVKQMYVTASKNMEKFVNFFKEFKDAFDKNQLTDAKLRELSELSKTYYKNENELIQMVAKMKAYNNIYKTEIAKTKAEQSRSEKLEKKLNDLQSELMISNAELEIAGQVPKRDKDGNIIETIDESMLIPDMNDMTDITMGIRSYLDGIDESLGIKGLYWHPVLNSSIPVKDDGKSNYSKIRAIYNSLPPERKYVKTTKDGSVRIEEFNDLAKYYRKTIRETDEFDNKTDIEKESIAAHNEKVRATKVPVTEPITHDMIVKKRLEIKALEDKLRTVHKDIKYKDKQLELMHDLEVKRQELQAMIDNTPDSQLSDEDLKKLTVAKRKNRELQQDLERKDKKHQQIGKLQDEADSIELSNKVKEGLLESDSNVDTALENSVQARVAADKAQKLTKAKEDTYKAEQDKRMTEYELNAMNSDKIKASNEKIAQTMAERRVLEDERKQMEELKRKQQLVNEEKIARRGLEIYNQMSKRNKTFDTMLGQVDSYIDKMFDEHATTRKEQDKILNKLERDPELHLAYVKDSERRGEIPFQTETDLRTGLQTQDAIDNFNSRLNRLARPKTPPPTFGRVYRFYGTPKYNEQPRVRDLDTDDDPEPNFDISEFEKHD